MGASWTLTPLATEPVTLPTNLGPCSSSASLMRRSPSSVQIVIRGRSSHLCFVVVVAGGRCEVVEPLDLCGRELDRIGGHVLLDPGDALGAGNGARSSPCASKPCDRHLRRCGAHVGGDRLDSTTIRKFACMFSPVNRFSNEAKQAAR